MRITRFAGVLVAAVAVVAMSACQDSPDGADDSAESPGTMETTDAPDGESDVFLPPITLEKSGGIAGVSEVVELTPEGTWSYAKGKMAPETGELTEEQIATLSRAALDPELLEASKPDDGACPDGFTYTLTVTPVESVPVESVSDTCSSAPNDAFDEILTIMVEATPLD